MIVCLQSWPQNYGWLVIFIFSLLANCMPGDSTLRNLEVNLQKETFNWFWSFPTQFILQTMAQSSKRIVVPFYLLLQKLVQWDHWKESNGWRKKVFCVSLFNGVGPNPCTYIHGRSKAARHYNKFDLFQGSKPLTKVLKNEQSFSPN